MSELQLVDGAGCVQSKVTHHLPEAEYSESSLIYIAHATGILMIKLVYAVVKYGNGRSSSVDVFTEVSFKHASFAIAAGSLFTEVLFQHPFTAETVFHVKPNIPNPRHL